MDIGREDLRVYRKGAEEQVAFESKSEKGFAYATDLHVANFLECVRTRKLPNGDVLIGHRSAQASHLGNLAYIQKRRLDFDPVREEILPF